jgi:two-component system OmpR family response regulator
MRVLVVEDDPGAAQMLTRALTKDGYAVDVVTDGEDALWAATEVPYAAIVLDRMIPPPDGLEVCRRLRTAGNWVPVLLLTARDAVADRVEGLDAGADDYLTKPFAVVELFARVRALVRRAPTERPAIIVIGDLTLDPAVHRAERAGHVLDLTPRGFTVLEVLMRHAGEVVTRTQLLEQAWDLAYDGGSNVVDATVSRLRELVDRPFASPMIETVRGVGYRLKRADD